MTNDETIILNLTRENARLKLQSELLIGDLDRVKEALDRLGSLAAPPRDEDQSGQEGWSTVDRACLLASRVKEFPLILTDHFHQLPGQLYRVTIPTSIDDIEDYVVAKDEQMVERWLSVAHARGFKKGYESKIELAHPDLGNVHWVSVPEGACCESERRNMNGGCDNCGAPCL